MRRGVSLGYLLPNFFVIGAGQSGTTSLLRYLCLHPQVHVPVLKEPNFFCREEDGPWPFGRVKERSEYESLYDTRLPLRGDCSPSYSQDPLRPGVPERIVAHYVHDVSSVGEERSFADALADLDDPLNPYVVGSSYAHQLAVYREHFPEDRILVVDSADLKANREEALRRIFGFLGADESFTSPGFDEELNVGSTKRAHNPSYARARDSRLGEAWRRLPGRVRSPLSGAARRASAPPVKRPKPGEKLRDAMAARLGPEVQRLREMTGQSFETWSV